MKVASNGLESWLPKANMNLVRKVYVVRRRMKAHNEYFNTYGFTVRDAERKGSTACNTNPKVFRIQFRNKCTGIYKLKKLIN